MTKQYYQYKSWWNYKQAPEADVKKFKFQG
jgi:hypothetical protein